MTTIYNDQTYLNNNPSWHEEDAPFKAEKVISLLERNTIEFQSICEIGCGSGEILVQLSKKFPHLSYTGFDISADAITIARKKETDRIKFEEYDIAENNPDKFYDLLLVMDVIEHVEDYFKFLDHTFSMGKYTVFHIPLDISVWSLFREDMLIESKKRVGHIHNFTEKFIISILSDKGFELIDKMYTEPAFPKGSFKQKMINVLRKSLFAINKKFCTKFMGGYSVLLLTKNKQR